MRRGHQYFFHVVAILPVATRSHSIRGIDGDARNLETGLTCLLEGMENGPNTGVIAKVHDVGVRVIVNPTFLAIHGATIEFCHGPIIQRLLTGLLVNA